MMMVTKPSCKPPTNPLFSSCPRVIDDDLRHSSQGSRYLQKRKEELSRLGYRDGGGWWQKKRWVYNVIGDGASKREIGGGGPRRRKRPRRSLLLNKCNSCRRQRQPQSLSLPDILHLLVCIFFLK